MAYYLLQDLLHLCERHHHYSNVACAQRIAVLYSCMCVTLRHWQGLRICGIQQLFIKYTGQLYCCVSVLTISVLPIDLTFCCCDANKLWNAFWQKLDRCYAIVINPSNLLSTGLNYTEWNFFNINNCERLADACEFSCFCLRFAAYHLLTLIWNSTATGTSGH